MLKGFERRARGMNAWLPCADAVWRFGVSIAALILGLLVGVLVANRGVLKGL